MTTKESPYCDDSPQFTSFCELVRSILNDYDLSNAEFAQKIGVTKGTITKILAGSYSSKKPYKPGIDIVLAIAVVYGIPVVKILEMIRPGYSLCEKLCEKKNNLDDVNILLDKHGYQALNIR